MQITRKLAIAGAGLLSLVGIGGGVAMAQSTPPPAPAVTAPAQPSAQPTAEPTTPEKAETPGAPESAEKPGVEEPGDASLPGGGHADPPGQTVDTQFEGVQ
jgi:hypothetical protein